MRPTLHFTAATGWINDPHGITFHGGRYHLFHQYVPDGADWAPGCQWGHATSTDLLTWTRHEVAIAPGEGDDGIWTGCLVDDGARSRIFYTSVSHPDLAIGRVRVASPADPGWERWTKGDVVLGPPDDLDLVVFRDPFVLREAAGWRMLVGAATRDGEALALTYTSPDLAAWTYDGVLASRSTRDRDPIWTGAMWECPQLVEVDGHWLLIGSVWDHDVLHHVAYGIGDRDAYVDGRFEPTDWGQLTYGDSYYAASFFRDEAGRPCLMSWMRGVADRAQGWAGCLSIPFRLAVRDGRVTATPHPALAAARTSRLAAGEPATSFELAWSPLAGGDELVLSATSGAETARITLDAGTLSLDRPGETTWSMPWHGADVRIVVDGSVVEVSSTGILGGPVGTTHTWGEARGPCEAWVIEAGAITPPEAP